MDKDEKPILEVKNLVKKFGNFTAVDGVSFHAREGQILGFLGPNGAGKSTTIFCILGLIEKDEGSISIFGKDLFGERSVVLKQMNYASAEFTLPWNLTLGEGMRVFSKLYEVPNAKKRIAELLELFELSDMHKKLIRDLSLGQRARANLCKAFINKPRLLLLDEPMASMDPDIVDKGIKLIRRLQEEDKMTILYTSHNMWEIEQITNHVVFINHGKVVAQGSALELTRQFLDSKTKEPNLREVFLHLSRTGVMDGGQEE